ncbi:MAG: hypothetical protein IJH20_04665 [Bacilli bacterium]|nr:hypothetical protein [Bacilli bacterium]
MYQGYNPYINYGIKTSRFSFSNVLNTAQKTLNIVNQALPIVKEVRPIIKNARTLFAVAKGINSINNSNKTDEIKKQNSVKEQYNEGLNFFV